MGRLFRTKNPPIHGKHRKPVKAGRLNGMQRGLCLERRLVPVHCQECVAQGFDCDLVVMIGYTVAVNIAVGKRLQHPITIAVVACVSIAYIATHAETPYGFASAFLIGTIGIVIGTYKTPPLRAPA